MRNILLRAYAFKNIRVSQNTLPIPERTAHAPVKAGSYSLMSEINLLFSLFERRVIASPEGAALRLFPLDIGRCAASPLCLRENALHWTAFAPTECGNITLKEY